MLWQDFIQAEHESMGAVQKISISLSEELARDIEAAVAIGDYSTTSEVVRDALRAWKQQRAERVAEIERLRALWAEGVASGEARPFTREVLDRIIAEGMDRLEQRRAS